MKKILFTYIFLVQIFNTFSQEKFNRIYGNLESPVLRNIIVQDNKYIALGGAYTYTDIIILFYNLSGDIDSLKEYGNDTTQWMHGVQNSLQPTGTGNYILAGQRGVNWYRDNMLVKFDSNFDTIFTKIYYPVNDNGNQDVLNYNACVGTDNSYLMVGHTNISNNYDSLYKKQIQLIKTDTLGNLLWRKTYGNDTYDHYGYKVVNAFDGGYLLGGWCSRNGGDWALIKTDINGENPIYRYFGHPTNGEGRIMGITPTSDSCYIITGAYAISYGGVDKARVLKLDKSLNIVWDRLYLNIGDVSFFYKALEKENGNLYLYGAHDNNLNYKMSAIMELTSGGDSLWRQITTGNDTVRTGNNLENGKITPDGGLIFAGYIFDVNLTPYQQMWLVKTDSLGCDGSQWTNCGITNIPEINKQTNKNALRIYPNPAKELIYVELNNNKPASTKSTKQSEKTRTLIKSHKNSLSKEDFKQLTIQEKLAYNIKHPEQNYWGKEEEQEMFDIQKQNAYAIPFDAIKGKVDIFSIDPALALRVGNKTKKEKTQEIQKATDTSFSLSSAKPKTQELIVYNIYGQELIRTLSTGKITSINISKLKKGIYFVKSGNNVAKFVKE